MSAVIVCIDCEAAVPRRSYNQKRCVNCQRHAQRLAENLRYAARNPLKGCLDCGTSISRRRKRCESCFVDCKNARNREWRRRNAPPRIVTITCLDCGTEVQRTSGNQKRCSPCAPRGRTATNRLWAYGITAECSEQIISAQNGLCGVCAGPLPKNMHLDHNHTTGEIRGWLCSKCNLGLGLLGDNPSTLRAAADYIENPPARAFSGDIIPGAATKIRVPLATEEVVRDKARLRALLS